MSTLICVDDGGTLTDAIEAMRPVQGLSARLRRWLVTEPLLHFIALGALIFGVYGAYAPTDAANRRIEVSAQDLARLRQISIKQWAREPDARTMQDLVQSYVREEVLYREALASGMDRDDVIVRRRLTQKMEFLANQEVRAPSEAELHAYFDSHAQQFLQAAQVDFEQVYFSTANGKLSAETDARKALARLRAGYPVHGDNFMLPATVLQQDQQELQRDYGGDFAQALFAQPSGVWVGPIASAHGLHLVRVKQQYAAQGARFEDVRERVAADLTNAAVEKARTDAYQRLLARYTVVMAPMAATPSEVKVSLASTDEARP